MPKQITDLYLRESNTSKNDVLMTYNEIFNEVGTNLSFPVKTLQVMSYIESRVGMNKGKGDGINSLGYVGLMQFGKLASIQVADRCTKYLNTLNDMTYYSKYKNIIILPKEWSNKPELNNKLTNSLFDDYISTVASVYLALDNLKIIKSSTDNIVDIYLAHQQGAGGLRLIKNNPNSPMNKAALLNLPNIAKEKTLVTNLDWYQGWLKQINDIALSI